MPRSARLLALTAALAALAGLPSLPGAAARPGCAPSLAGGLASTRSAAQLVTVVAAGPASTRGSLRLWERKGACWASVAGPWRTYLGFAGVSGHHREGDGTTPAGAFAVGPALFGVSPDPGVHYRYHRLVCGDWWDEDPRSPTYNTFQHVPCGAQPPFGGASEALWKSAHAYAHFAPIEYNTRPAIPGRGSAIFVHDDLGHPTNGCITLPPGQLLRLLRWLRPELSPLVVIGTAAGIRSF